jgi:hypothetical protein
MRTVARALADGATGRTSQILMLGRPPGWLASRGPCRAKAMLSWSGALPTLSSVGTPGRKLDKNESAGCVAVEPLGRQ